MIFIVFQTGDTTFWTQTNTCVDNDDVFWIFQAHLRRLAIFSFLIVHKTIFIYDRGTRCVFRKGKI